MLQALFDIDYAVYRVGFGKKAEPLEWQIAALDELLYLMQEEVQADFNVFYLSDSKENNFRYLIDAGYKAGRGNRPEFYEELRQHLIDSWCAEIAINAEADDALALNNVNTDTVQTLLVSPDKDVLTVPGKHYDPVKKEFREVSERAAVVNYYTQCLTGDSVDSIKGVKGIGPKKADKLLAGCTHEQDYYEVVRKAYGNDTAMVQNASLLWLLSNERTNLIKENHGSIWFCPAV